MKKFLKKLLLGCTLLTATLGFGQNADTKSFGASDNFGNDAVDLTTLVPTINFPGLQKSQGALPGSTSLSSPQACGLQVIVSGTPPTSHSYWLCGINFGYPAAGIFPDREEMIGMNLIYTVSSYLQGTIHCNQYTVSGIIDFDNVSAHRFANTNIYHPSQCGVTTADVITNDGSGYSLHLIAGVSAPTIGTISNASGWTGNLSSSDTVTDPFNNSLTYSFGTSTNTFTDTLGAVTTDTFRNNGAYNDLPDNYAYTDTGGTTRNIAITYGSARNFVAMNAGNCSTVTSAISVTPPVSISYPDGTSVSLGWTGNSSSTTGLINSVTLREGGTISYSYGNIIAGVLSNYCEWAYSSLARTTPDGTWNYSLSFSNGVTTTTVLDPGNNKTVYTFAGFSGLLHGMPVFLTSVYRYQNTGTVASPVYALISNTSYCYNNVSCSTAPSYPITQRDTYEYIGTNSTQMSHRVETYDTYGNITDDSTTDSVTGQKIEKAYTYGTYNGTSCVALGNGNIHDHVCEVETIGAGSNIAETLFTYNSNGALTERQDWTGSSWLATNYTPNNNGTTASMTAPNGQVTTNTYGNCNSLLLTDSTTTVNSVAIDNKKTWNCNGSVVVDTTDPNGNEDDTTYDAMFRVVSHTDRMENTTTYSYGGTTNSYLATTDPLGVIRYGWTDGLGRTKLTQTKQSPSGSNYDTVSIVNQWNGTNFQTQTTVPCVQTYGNGCPATYELTLLTNPIAGPISANDANNGTVNFGLGSSSSGADSSVTAGPAPSGENTKVVQTEKDGIGRVKSTCALEASGGSPCGQALGNSGILTSTSYSFATGSSTNTTTRGSQTHTKVFDALGRTTSTTTPEAGTTTFVYDTDGSSGCNYTSNGSLVRKNNPDANSICFYYDGLGRLRNTWTTAGVTGDYCEAFVYDSTSNDYFSPPSGYPSSGANLVGRMVEAFTYFDNGHGVGNCPSFPLASGDLLTDEWFAYDKDGRMTDMWEWTSLGNTYYHTTVAYDADGTVTSLSGIPNVSTLTYAVDGEDRWNTATLGSTTIVSGVTYDAASRPTQINIWSGTDNDQYTYDNVGNMKTYQFFVGSNNNKGTLTWNSIGSLGSLAVVDGFNSSNNQTCNFAYDDVARITTDNCGSVWSQTYDYGVNGGEYENLSKSGNSSWNPGYNTSNNQYQNGATYDSNGNLKTDGANNTYTWNVYGQKASENSNTITHDALGRVVASGSYEYLYSPLGFVEFLSGGGPYFGRIPLPGGSVLDARANNANYYYHQDWIGSLRVASHSSGVDWSRSLSPYGDVYPATTDVNNRFAGIDMGVPGGTTYVTPSRELATNASRWLSPDPAHASWNAYSYVTDPNMQTDSSGLGSSQGCPAGDACDKKANDPCTGSGLIQPCGGKFKIIVVATPLLPPSGGGSDAMEVNKLMRAYLKRNEFTQSLRASEMDEVVHRAMSIGKDSGYAIESRVDLAMVHLMADLEKKYHLPAGALGRWRETSGGGLGDDLANNLAKISSAKDWAEKEGFLGDMGKAMLAEGGLALEDVAEFSYKAGESDGLSLLLLLPPPMTTTVTQKYTTIGRPHEFWNRIEDALESFFHQ